MQLHVREHIAKLREEIAQIREANSRYLKETRKMPSATHDHERRSQRLQDILDELASLTDWKKV